MAGIGKMRSFMLIKCTLSRSDEDSYPVSSKMTFEVDMGGVNQCQDSLLHCG